MALLSVEDLRTYCFTREAVLKAVDGVSFSVDEGEALGIVGESGCGKSMTCASIVRLLPGSTVRTVSGKILFEGENLLEKSQAEMVRMRGRKIATILQDPLTSLNPVYTIGNQVGESITLHRPGMTRARVREEVAETLRRVRIPAERIDAYPFQLSGGMRQRTVAAMAIAGNPRLLIADEPTTALDVTVQAQFLALLGDLRQRTRMALVLVTHDLGIVAETCDRVVVMYAGRIVEAGTVATVFHRPVHPYTEALLAALPRIGERRKRLSQIRGEPPQLARLPGGCSFWPRCEKAQEVCRSAYPPTRSMSSGREVACWFAAEE